MICTLGTGGNTTWVYSRASYRYAIETARASTSRAAAEGATESSTFKGHCCNAGRGRQDLDAIKTHSDAARRGHCGHQGNSAAAPPRLLQSTYTVKSGDTLSSKIAKELLGGTLRRIRRSSRQIATNSSDPDKIEPGQGIEDPRTRSGIKQRSSAAPRFRWSRKTRRDRAARRAAQRYILFGVLCVLCWFLLFDSLPLFVMLSGYA
mgnify:CR=1 FL=1